ncbi:hypothetical protein BU14_0218s0032 [Porphyra umbilicalis]|uniref:Ionotropic glutamate receptor C-terminal domain-containing protein n=1 Tax=Porphyra umbilicalis TaxID=2786 RepID=A0A1X6P527_PORUM|nr:hypothetical protein BU14_0218s0032 [Porphyra umbilicalis]|eukprot:OSX75866.1 hypothetical protein BU14_0218s0032 [Porphyra umbilicalis]
MATAADASAHRRRSRPRCLVAAAAAAAVAVATAAASAAAPATAIQTLRVFALFPTGQYEPADPPGSPLGPDAEANAAAAAAATAAADASAAVEAAASTAAAAAPSVNGANGTAGALSPSARQVTPVAPTVLAFSRMLLDAVRLGFADATAPGGVLPPDAMTVELVPIDTKASLLAGTHILCRTISSEAAVASAADAYATVGPLDSDFLWLATVTAYQWNVPLVSSAATALALNSVDDSELWPVNATSASGEPTSYLFHTVPRDDLRVTAVVELIVRMKRQRDAVRARRPWSIYGSERIGVLYSEDQFGQSGMYSLYRRLSAARAASSSGGLDDSTIPVRLVRMLSIPSDGDAWLALQDLHNADVRIVVVWSAFLVPGAAAILFEQAGRLGMLGDGHQWIVTAPGETLFGPGSKVTPALARRAVGILTVEPTVPAGRLTSAPAQALLTRLAAAGAAASPPDGDRQFVLDTFASYALYAYDAAGAVARAAAAVVADGGFPEGPDKKRFATNACHWGAPWMGGEAFHKALSGVAFPGLSGDLNYSVPYAARGASYIVQNLQLAPQSATAAAAASGAAAAAANSADGSAAGGNDADGPADGGGSLGVRWVDLLRFDIPPAPPPNRTGASAADAAATDLALGNRAGSWTRMRVSDVRGAAAVRQVYPGLRRLYPSDRPVIRSRKLRVLTQHAPPFVFHKTFPDGTESFSGLSLELWNRVAEALLVDYELESISAATASNVMVDRVANGTVDLALSWTTVTAERMRRVTFTQPYHYLGLRFLVLADSVKVELSSLARPFSNALWGLVLASVVAFAGLLHWFEGDDDPDGDFRDAASLPSACVNAIYHAGLTLVQDREYAPVTVEGRVITFGYVFFALIIVSSYAAELFSFLTFSKTDAVISSLADLQSNKVPLSRVGIETGGSVQAYIEEEILGCFPNCPRPPKAYTPCVSSLECYKKLQAREVTVLINDGPVLEYQAMTDCSVVVVGEPFYDQGYGIMQRTDPDLQLVDDISNTILRLQEDGYLQQLETRWFSRSACPSAVGEAGERLGVKSLASIFVATGSVFLLAAVFHGLVKHSPPFRRVLTYLRTHPRPRARGRAGKLRGKGGNLNDAAFASASESHESVGEKAAVAERVRGPRGAHRPPSLDVGGGGGGGGGDGGGGGSLGRPRGAAADADGLTLVTSPQKSFDLGSAPSSSSSPSSASLSTGEGSGGARRRPVAAVGGAAAVAAAAAGGGGGASDVTDASAVAASPPRRRRLGRWRLRRRRSTTSNLGAMAGSTSSAFDDVADAVDGPAASPVMGPVPPLPSPSLAAAADVPRLPVAPVPPLPLPSVPVGGAPAPVAPAPPPRPSPVPAAAAVGNGGPMPATTSFSDIVELSCLRAAAATLADAQEAAAAASATLSMPPPAAGVAASAALAAAAVPPVSPVPPVPSVPPAAATEAPSVAGDGSAGASDGDAFVEVVLTAQTDAARQQLREAARK